MWTVRDPATRSKSFHGSLLLALALLPALAGAEGVFNVVFENDAFGGTDYHYTSGIQLDYVMQAKAGRDSIREAASRLPQIDSDDRIYLGWHLGQQIYTPENIRTDKLLPEQRPYAGYLYGSFSLTAGNSEELDSWRFTLGTVGPDARAREFQQSIHRRLGVNVARGWDHQLNDEAVFQFDYQKSWREVWAGSGSGLSADLLPFAGVALGNAALHVDAGVNFRIGKGLNNDFGPPRLRPSLPGSGFFHGHSGWYFFAGLGGRYVWRNIFLDGNTHSPSHRVDKFRWVGDLQLGWVLNHENLRLSYTFVGRSREYRGQTRPDRFGSLSVSLRF